QLQVRPSSRTVQLLGLKQPAKDNIRMRIVMIHRRNARDTLGASRPRVYSVRAKERAGCGKYLPSASHQQFDPPFPGYYRYIPSAGRRERSGCEYLQDGYFNARSSGSVRKAVWIAALS